MKNLVKSALLAMFVSSAFPLLAQAADAAQPVTVVTLTSTTLPALSGGALTHPVVAQPIRVVDGGVKATAGSCFDLDGQGNVVPVAGDCVVLRSVPR